MKSNRPIQLFCFPYAGGTANSYMRFQKTLGGGFMVVPLDPPGHGKLLDQPPLRTLDGIVDALYGQMLELLEGPFAFFGHSLGAHLAYLVARRLHDDGRPLPMHLFVSGNGSPSVPFRHKNIHLLPDDEFLQRVRGYGGMPDEFLTDRDLLALFTPILKADFEAMSGYEYREEPPLDVPVTALFGDHDIHPLDDIRNWQRETIQQVTFHEYPGNHFFVFDYADDIARLIARTIRDESGWTKRSRVASGAEGS